MQTSRKTLYFSFIGILLAVFCLNCGVKYPKKKVETSELAIHHNNRGVVYLKQGDLERAEWEFRTSAEISKKYADPHNNLGLVYKYRGEYPQALQSFRNAMKADAKWAAPYNHVGATYLAMGNIGQAVVYIKRAIAIDKKYGEAYYNLGLCYLARGREKADGGKVDSAYLHQAVKYLKKATDADVNIYHAHLELGDIYRDLGEWENAIVRYRVAIETNPTSPIPWGRLGALYYKMGDFAKAESSFAQALARHPTDEYHVQIGEAFLQQGFFEEALAEFLKAAQKNPQNGHAFFDMGFTLDKLKRHEEATQAYKRALDVSPNFANAAFNLGMSYIALQQTGEAARAFQKALTIDPSHARSLYNLGMLYNDTGQPAKANQYLCRFIKVVADDETFDVERSIARKTIDDHGGCGAF